MFTIIGLVSLTAGFWAAFEILTDIAVETHVRQTMRRRGADYLLLATAICVVITSLHSLARI